MPIKKKAEPDCAGLTVLQVIPELNGGGAETTTLEIASALHAEGARALIVSQGGRLESRLAAVGAEIIKLPVASKNPVTMWANSRKLADIIRAEGVDLIHARSRAPAWSSFFAARQTRIPYLATYHGMVHSGPALKVFYNSVLTRGAGVIANSHYTGERIALVHGLGDEKIHIIPRGCDVDRLNPKQWDKKARLACRDAWGVSQTDFVILCPARITEIKGQHILIAALAAVSSDKCPVLVLAGGGQAGSGYRDRLEAQIDDLGLAGRIVFAGHVDNMPLAYAASDLAVLPSIRPEPFGRTIIEAGAAGLPVIASDDGGFRETVVTGDAAQATGWLTPPGDVTALALALEASLRLSASQLKKIGQNGMRHVGQNFTQQNMCRATLAVYAQILGR